jgi:hypothetical protein
MTCHHSTLLVRTSWIASIALACGLAASTHAGTAVLGESGWQAEWDASLDGRVEVDFIDVIGNTIFIQKAAEFTDAPVDGMFAFIGITFRQVGASSVDSIVIDDEIISNSTGATWTGFVMKVMNGTTTFDPAQTAASGGGGPIGFSIDPFTTATFASENHKLRISGGLLADGETWFPGGSANDGQLWINVTSGSGDDMGVFTLKERPTAEIIPAPSAVLTIAGLLGLARRRRRER